MHITACLLLSAFLCVCVCMYAHYVCLHACEFILQRRINAYWSWSVKRSLMSAPNRLQKSCVSCLWPTFIIPVSLYQTLSLFLSHPAYNPPPSPTQFHLLRHASRADLETITPNSLFSPRQFFTLEEWARWCRHLRGSGELLNGRKYTETHSHCIQVSFVLVVDSTMWSLHCVPR